MIEWYRDKKAGVFFDDAPHVCMRYILPSSTNEEKKSIKKYPFINKKNLQVLLADYQKNKIYNFTIPKGYCYDGASIPRLFWRIIGSNTDNRFLVPALIHDVLCEHHDYVDYDRKFSTYIFNSLLQVSEVSSFQRFLMKNSVDVFQKLFCGWTKSTKKGCRC